MAIDRFPVDERALPRATIPAQRLEDWKALAHEEITRALSHPHSWYNAFREQLRDGFSSLTERPQLQSYVRSVPKSSDKDVLVRATLENTTLDDIVQGAYADTTFDVRCVSAHLYEDAFLDAALLQVHETQTVDDPMHFVGVKWLAFRSPAPSVVASRDFVYFSYEGSAIDRHGQRVVFRFLRTMPMDDDWVDSSRLPPLVRGKLSNVHIYRQDGTRVVVLTRAMQSNAGNMPSWVVTKTISFMYPGISNMETIANARAIVNQGLSRLVTLRQSSRSTSSVSSSSSGGFHLSLLSSSSSSSSAAAFRPGASHHTATSACSVCYHKFSLTRSKRTCQGCTRTVCKRCTHAMFFFDETKQVSTTGVARLRFCFNCTRQARQDAISSRHDSELGSARSAGPAARYGFSSATTTPVSARSAVPRELAHNETFLALHDFEGDDIYDIDADSSDDEEADLVDDGFDIDEIEIIRDSERIPKAGLGASKVSATRIEVPDPRSVDELDDLDDIREFMSSEILDSDDYSISGSFDCGPDGASSIIKHYAYDDDEEDEAEEEEEVQDTFVPMTPPSPVRMLSPPPRSPSDARIQSFSSSMSPMRANEKSARPQGVPGSPVKPPSLSLGQLDSPTEAEAEAQMPTTKNRSAPNLLSYGATKRTNRPGGAGIAPLRPGLHRAASMDPRMHQQDLSATFRLRLKLHDSMPRGARPQPLPSPSSEPQTPSPQPQQQSPPPITSFLI
ncbi:hypothetical protein P43SY_009533 [Pythium insidiosum]|uniref:FYVE-type domain-containing protein n=1 Tax=Pythium insidiosum TaxID=114742 RepID=A0AAD5MA48_PYTIN|nr:hypothetical protein P43SY_009533 [Pythium insidiosum]